MKFTGDRPPLGFLGIDEPRRQCFELGCGSGQVPDTAAEPPLETEKVKNAGERQHQSGGKSDCQQSCLPRLQAGKTCKTSPGPPRPVVDCSKGRFFPMFPGCASVAGRTSSFRNRKACLWRSSRLHDKTGFIIPCCSVNNCSRSLQQRPLFGLTILGICLASN